MATLVTVPFEGTACVPEPAELVGPDPALAESLAASGPLQLGTGGAVWALVDGQIWVGRGAEVAAGTVGSATAATGEPRALVSSEPGCETVRLRGGSELLALSCRDEQFDMISGPCWVTRHDPATGATPANHGPFAEVFGIRWAGSDMVLRTIDTLEAPDRNRRASGRFLFRGDVEGPWGVDGAVYQMHEDSTLHRYDLACGPTVSRRVTTYRERVLGVHDEGLLVERGVTDDPPTFELAVWDPLTLEDSFARPISGSSTLLDTGEVVVQRPVGHETVPRDQDFTTEMLLHGVASGAETSVMTVDDHVAHRASWPTYRPLAIIDDELVATSAW